MPTYEYIYEREDSTKVKVLRRNVPMSEAADPIEVDDEDGNTYVAERIISLVADMSNTWEDDVKNSDLPPVDYTPEQVKADIENRKTRARQHAHAKKKKATTG